MTVPFIPTPFATPIINPAVGSQGVPPLAYISNSQFEFAPTALSITSLFPGGSPSQQTQDLSDTIRQASRWCDGICFGQDPADKGASLAASLSVESAYVRIKSGELRLICDYRPLIQLVGVAVGSGMSDLAGIDSTLAGLARVGRRTFTIPYAGPVTVSRSGDYPTLLPGGISSGSVYAVWSYVNGYPHTRLLSSVTVGATSCVVESTDGNGGLWGVFAASGAFPGTQLTVIDQGQTERVFVTSVTANSPQTGQTTLGTSAFVNAHTIPASPDFIPVTGLPEDVHRAVISLTMALVKVRGAKAMVMPTVGGRPTRTALAQAGGLEDYEIAEKILADGGYIVRVRKPGAY